MARKVYEEFVDYSNNNSDVSNVENPVVSSKWNDNHNNFNKQLSNYDTLNSNSEFDDSMSSNLRGVNRYFNRHSNNNNNNNNNSGDDIDENSHFFLNDNHNQMNYSHDGKSTNLSYSSFFSDRQLQSPMRNSKFYTDNNNTYSQSDQSLDLLNENEEQDSGSNSSVTIHSSTRLSHDPFDTVQQRHKSSNRTTMDDPEFLSYLRKGQRRDNLKHGNPNLTRNSLNDLIVKGIGELSGEVYNTFKNKKTKNSNNNNSNNNNSNNNNNNNNNNSSSSNNYSNNDNGSNYNINTINSSEEEEQSEDLETSNEVLRDANNVFDDMISQNKNKMTLITPLVAGLNFENNLGKWVRDIDQTNSQDISANHTVADISSSTATTTATHPSERKLSKIHLFKDLRTSNNHRSHSSDNNDNVNNTNTNYSKNKNKNKNKNNDIDDDDSRQVKNTKRNGQNSILEDTPLPFRIKTGFQDLESSIETLEAHKMQLIRKLTPLLIDRDWETVTELDAKGQDLKDITSLALCLPSLIKCDLSNNNIKLFNSGNSIPKNLIELNLSKNLINDTYIYNDNNNDSNDSNNSNNSNNVKILNLSNNQFKTDLSWLGQHGFINVQKLNISSNRIRSLNGLPSGSMIKRIDLSDNCIRGPIDFEELMEEVGEYGWHAVEHLDLSNNEITEVYNLDRLRSLRSINLNGNPLVSVIFHQDMNSGEGEGESESESETTSTCMSKVEILKIRSDRLKIVGKSRTQQFLPLPRLKELEIRCYKRFPEMKFLPTGMVKLSILGGDVEDLISLSKIPGSLQKLEIVGIGRMRELPRDPRMEIRLMSIQELNLSYNDLSSWENLIQFLPYSHLKILKLDGNKRLLYENGRMNRERLEPELKGMLKRAIPCLEYISI
ncbi:Nud1p PWA37_002324 [Arxiozyma heterogenica]|uniref:Nud1p n=1 Tax=Arxiozyma heterogenica TaxID=278026 RepID=UPI002EF3BE2E